MLKLEQKSAFVSNVSISKYQWVCSTTSPLLRAHTRVIRISSITCYQKAKMWEQRNLGRCWFRLLSNHTSA